MMYPQTAYVEYYRSLTAAVDERISSALGHVRPVALRAALTGIIMGGKRIRPLLTLASARAAGGSEKQALSAAAAVELLHTSSLIHDDIMDHSPLRRGHPAIHVRHGVPMAILAGDALIAVGFRMIHEVSSPRKDEIVSEFTSAFLELCEGQALDLQLAGEKGRSLSDHQRMVERKTAKLFGAATTIGALVATSDKEVVRALRVFGLHIGMAYQAKDDLLDEVGSERALGKPTGNDLRNGKQTYLKLAYLRPGIETMTSVSAVDSVACTVTEFTERAVRALEAVPAGPARQHLEQLAASLAQRKL